jgi:hypothetical protein
MNYQMERHFVWVFENECGCWAGYSEMVEYLGGRWILVKYCFICILVELEYE